MIILQQLKNLGLTQFNFDCLMACIDSDDDVDEFLDYYWYGKKYEFNSIVNYRKHKIKQDNISFEEFKDMYKEDKKKALERLFRHQMYDIYIERADKLSPKNIYNLHQSDIFCPLMFFI